MGKVIPVTIRDKIATAPKDALYVCGNSDFVIQFDFDDEWSGVDVKTARFVYNGRHQDKVFEGSICPVPVISNTYSFHVGVFASNLRTTTAARIPCKKSILCGSGSPDTPPPDVYAQIIEMLNARVNINQGQGNAGNLLYVREDGMLVPLTLGDGLEIVDGVLRVTGAITPQTEIIFEDAGGGMVTMSGTEFVRQADGAVMIDGAIFTDQGGIVLIN